MPAKDHPGSRTRSLLPASPVSPWATLQHSLARVAGPRCFGSSRAISSRGRGAFPLLLAALLTPACERKAPGPEECVQFAERWFDEDRDRVHLSPTRAKYFDEVVHKCLTTPYDKEYVECVLSGGANARCQRAFERRRLRSGGEP